MKSRRGVSIVEVVIAMLVIVTISGVSLGILIRSNNISDDSLSRYNARLYADGALGAFMYAESRDEFEGALGLSDTGTGYTYEAKYYRLDHLTVDRNASRICFYTPAQSDPQKTVNHVTTGNLFADFEIDDYDLVVDTINSARIPEEDLTEQERRTLSPGQKTLPRFDSISVTYGGRYVYEATYQKVLWGLGKDEKNFTEHSFSITVSDTARTIQFNDQDAGLRLSWAPDGNLYDSNGYQYKFNTDKRTLFGIYDTTTVTFEKGSTALTLPDMRFSNETALKTGFSDLLSLLSSALEDEAFSNEAGHELQCAESFHQYVTTRVYEMTDITATAADKSVSCPYEGKEHTHDINCFAIKSGNTTMSFTELKERPAGGMEVIPLTGNLPADMLMYRTTSSGIFSGQKYYYLNYHGVWYQMSGKSSATSFMVSQICTKEEHIHSFACGYGGQFLFEGYYYDTNPDDIVTDETGMEIRLPKEILFLEYRTDEEFKDVLKRLNTSDYRFYESTQNVYEYEISGAKLKRIELDYQKYQSNGRVTFYTDQGTYPVSADKDYLSTLEDGYLAYQIKKIELNYDADCMKVRYTYADNSTMTVTYDTGLRLLRKLLQFKEASLTRVDLKLAANASRAAAYSLKCTLGGTTTTKTEDMECSEGSPADVIAELDLLESYINTKSENALSVTAISSPANTNNVQFSFKDQATTMVVSYSGDTHEKMFNMLKQYLAPTSALINYLGAAPTVQITFTDRATGNSLTMHADDMFETVVGYLDTLPLNHTTLHSDNGGRCACYHMKWIDPDAVEDAEKTMDIRVLYPNDASMYAQLKSRLAPSFRVLSYDAAGGAAVSYHYANNGQEFAYTLLPEDFDAGEKEKIAGYLSLGITKVELGVQAGQKKATYWFSEPDGAAVVPLQVEYANDAQMYHDLRQFAEPITLTLVCGASAGDDRLSYTFGSASASAVTITGSNVSLLTDDGVETARNYAEKEITDVEFSGDRAVIYTFAHEETIASGRKMTVQYRSDEQVLAVLKTILLPKNAILTCNESGNSLSYQFTDSHNHTKNVTTTDAAELAKVADYAAKEIGSVQLLSESKAKYTFGDGNALTVEHNSSASKADQYTILRRLLAPSALTLNLKENRLEYLFKQGSVSVTCYDTDGDDLRSAKDYSKKKIDGVTITGEDSATYLIGGEKLNVIYKTGLCDEMYNDLRKYLVPTALLVYSSASDAKMTYTFTAGKSVTFENSTDRLSEAMDHLNKKVTITAAAPSNRTVTYTDENGKSLAVKYWSQPQFLNAVRKKLTPTGITLHLFDQTVDYSFTCAGGNFDISGVTDGFSEAAAYKSKEITEAKILSNVKAMYTFSGGDQLTVVYPDEGFASNQCGYAMYTDLRKVLEPSAVKLTYTKNADSSVSAKMSYTFEAGKTVAFTGDDGLEDAENHLNVKAGTVTYTAPRTVTFTDPDTKTLTVEYADDAALLKTLRAKMTFTGLTLKYNSSDVNSTANTLIYSFQNDSASYSVTTREGWDDVSDYASKKITGITTSGNTANLVIDGTQKLTVQFYNSEQMLRVLLKLLKPTKLVLDRKSDELTYTYTLNGSSQTATMDAPDLVKDGNFLKLKITGVAIGSISDTPGSYSSYASRRVNASFKAEVTYTFEGETGKNQMTVVYQGDDTANSQNNYPNYTNIKKQLFDDLKTCLTPVYQLTYGSNGLTNATFAYVFKAGQIFSYDAALPNGISDYYKKTVESVSVGGTTTKPTATYTYAGGNKLEVTFNGYNDDMFEAIRRYMDLSEVTLNYNANGSVNNATIKFSGITTTFTGITVDSALLAKLDTLKQNQKMSSKTFNYTGKSAVFNFSNGTKLTENYANLTQFVQSYLQWNRLTYVDLNYPKQTVTFNKASTETWSNVSTTDMNAIKEAFMPDYMALDDVKSGSERVRSGKTYIYNYYVEYQFADDYTESGSYWGTTKTPTYNMRVYYSSQSEANDEVNRFKGTQQDVTYTVTFTGGKGTIKKGNETVANSDTNNNIISKMSELGLKLEDVDQENNSAKIKNFRYNDRSTTYSGETDLKITETSSGGWFASKSYSVSVNFKPSGSYNNKTYYYYSSEKRNNTTYYYFSSSSSSSKTKSDKAELLKELIGYFSSSNSSATITLTYEINETNPGASKEGTYGSLSQIPVFNGGSGTDGIKKWMQEAGTGTPTFFFTKTVGIGGIAELFATATGTGRLPESLYDNNRIPGSGNFSKLYKVTGNGTGGIAELFAGNLIVGEGDLSAIFSLFGNGSDALAEALFQLLTGGSGYPDFFDQRSAHSGVLEEILFRILGEPGSGGLAELIKLISGDGVLTGFGKLPFTGRYNGLNYRFSTASRTPVGQGINEENVGGHTVASYADWSITNRLQIGTLILDEGVKTDYKFYDEMKAAQVALNSAATEKNNYLIASGDIYKFEIRRYMGDVVVESNRIRVFDVAGDIVLDYPLEYMMMTAWDEDEGLTLGEAVADLLFNDTLMVRRADQPTHYYYRGRPTTNKQTGVVSYHDGNYYCVNMLAEFDTDEVESIVSQYNEGKASVKRYGNGFIRLLDIGNDLVKVTYSSVKHSSENAQDFSFEDTILNIGNYKMSTVAAHYTYQCGDGYVVNIVANYQSLEFSAEVVLESDPTNKVYTLHYTRG